MYYGGDLASRLKGILHGSLVISTSRKRCLASTLIQKAPHLRTGGYVIDFWGLGYEVVEKIGLRTELDSVGDEVREVRLVDIHGNKVAGFGPDGLRRSVAGP